MHNLDSNSMWDDDSQRSFWNRWIAENLSARPGRPDAIRTAGRVLHFIEALNLPPGASICEVGCANGWFTEKLLKYGHVTGIDLADAAIEKARQRAPGASLRSGDFNFHDFSGQSFDVVVSLETFSHINQVAFLHKVALVLKPGGHLILTTQNRFVYMRQTWVKPPESGQLRRWVSRRELKRMLADEFEVRYCFTVEPSGHRGILRIVNSPKLNGLMDAVIGVGRTKRFKEAIGLGQTIVLVAQKRDQRLGPS